MHLIDEIWAENANLGLNWRTHGPKEKLAQHHPLSAREMRFLFIEASPAHYTAEMTVTRLASAYAGASRGLIADALIM